MGTYICAPYTVLHSLWDATHSILPLCLDPCRAQCLKTYSNIRQWSAHVLRAWRLLAVTLSASTLFQGLVIQRELSRSRHSLVFAHFTELCKSHLFASLFSKWNRFPQINYTLELITVCTVSGQGHMLVIKDLHLGLLDDKRICCP